MVSVAAYLPRLPAMAGSVVLHGIFALAIGVMALAQTIVPPVVLPVASVAFVPIVVENVLPAPTQTAPISPADQMPAPVVHAAAPNSPESLVRSQTKPRHTKKQQSARPSPTLPEPQVLDSVNATAGPASAVATPATITQPLFEAAYLRNPPPDYPSAAKRRRQEGQVMLMVAVNASGAPTDVRVISSSGFELLDSAARDAVQRWQFVPAQQNGQAIAAEVRVPVMFRLE